MRFARLLEAFLHTVRSYTHMPFFCLCMLQQQHHTSHYNNLKQDHYFTGLRRTETNYLMVLLVFLDHVHGYFLTEDVILIALGE